jgi:uncharacterized membrane protein
VGDADVQNAGAVRFDDRGATTNIEVALEYDPPGGKAGELVAELFKDPDKQVQRAIDGFRRVVERRHSEQAESRQLDDNVMP